MSISTITIEELKQNNTPDLLDDTLIQQIRHMVNQNICSISNNTEVKIHKNNITKILNKVTTKQNVAFKDLQKYLTPESSLFVIHNILHYASHQQLLLDKFISLLEKIYTHLKHKQQENLFVYSLMKFYVLLDIKIKNSN